MEGERAVIWCQISATTRQTDRFVYEPYGLTDDEMTVVEYRTGARNTKEVDAHAR